MSCGTYDVRAWSHIPEDLSVNPPSAKLLFCDCVKNAIGYFMNLQHCGKKEVSF
jgi:hypothetical protein